MHMQKTETASSFDPELPVALLHESTTNPRRHFSADGITELAASIREKGLIEPIVVRPSRAAERGGIEAYEIVAGARRVRAAKLAGLDALPAIIRDYTDADLLELMLVENMQRSDLTPLEQAEGFAALIESNPTKHNVATIAQRIGMSPAWVWDRLKLNDLIGDARDLLATEKISAGHAVLLARLKPHDQERAIDPDNVALFVREHNSRFEELESDVVENDWDGYKPVTIREFERWIRDHVRFDPSHAAETQYLGFEDVAARVDEANDRPGKGKKVIAITYDYAPQQDAKDESERTYGYQHWERADLNPCGDSVLGVVVCGSRDYGKAFPVCVAKDRCTVHWAKEVEAREKAAKQRAKGNEAGAKKTAQKAADRWAREDRERQEEARRWGVLKPHALKAVVDGMKHRSLDDAALANLFKEVAWHEADRVCELIGTDVITAENFMWAIDVVDLIRASYSQDELEKAAKALGVSLDCDALEASIVAERLAEPTPAGQKRKGAR